MFHSSNYRVSYGDTDQMAVVYYGNYLEFFERSRTEMLRDCGLPYTELERRGWLLQLHNLWIGRSPKSSAKLFCVFSKENFCKSLLPPPCAPWTSAASPVCAGYVT